MTTDSDKTIAYYEDSAEVFGEATRSLDMAALYKPFTDLLQPGASILEAGCGSGRDARAFIEEGYKVTAFDASAKLARQASALAGIEVKLMRFEEIPFNAEFDGIWACASLLHVPMADFQAVLAALTRALKPGGILYTSFKYGEDEGLRNGRWFNDFNEAKLQAELSLQPNLELVRSWTTTDVRPNRETEVWLNCLCRRV